MTTKNQNYKPLECETTGGVLSCKAAVSYIKGTTTRSRVQTTTRGKDGVDLYAFAATAGNAIKVLPASACGPNYS